VPRLESSRRLLRATGAREGSLFGRWTDRELYRWLLEGRNEPFLAIRDELAAALVAADVEIVIGDAMEGFNPVHDLCRALIDGAVAEIRRRTGRCVANYSYALHPFAAEADEAPPQIDDDGVLRFALDEEALARKLAAAEAYPEMRGEVGAALSRFGRMAFALEVLRPSATARQLDAFASRTPHYETIGAQRVVEARYAEVIRYREHVLPALAAVGA
jgi:hypothetical protein